MNIDIIDRDGVDAGGGHQPRIVTNPLNIANEAVILIEKRSSRIAPLHTAVKVIPVVNHPQPVHRIHRDIKLFYILLRTDQPQQMKHSI
ncbi:hypothetical protein D3C73_1221510 [compost metagenome]